MITMTDGALPKGMKQGGSSAPGKRGMDRIGISIAIGITAVALILGIGFTGILPLDEMSSVMEPAYTAPVIQEKSTASYAPMKSSGSYVTSDKDLITQLDWTISTGNVMNMYLDADSSSLIIHTDTTDDGELFVGLNADYIGSDDGTFFILVDNQEHEDYEQAGMDLYIDLPAGAETVEIFGDYIVS